MKCFYYFLLPYERKNVIGGVTIIIYFQKIKCKVGSQYQQTFEKYFNMLFDGLQFLKSRYINYMYGKYYTVTTHQDKIWYTYSFDR